MAGELHDKAGERIAFSSPEAVPALYPPAEPLEKGLERFWDAGPELDEVQADPRPPVEPLQVLERLGASPFERGSFPVVGFLATTYERVSRYALDQR